MKKRRLLLITTQSLFGTGITSLLEEQKDQFMIETVPDVKSAFQACQTFRPDVVVYFREKSSLDDQTLLQELISCYQTRLIQCTLDANQLTIYDKTKIKNATVEDLMSAVMK